MGRRYIRIILIACLLNFSWSTGMIKAEIKGLEVMVPNEMLPVDIAEDHWAREPIDVFLSAGMIDGYRDESGRLLVKPNGDITRAQFIKMLINGLNLESDSPGMTFSDVKPGDWYYEYVQTASSLGIARGRTATQFKPHDKITRAQLAAMVVRAFEKTVNFSVEGKQFSDVPEDFWARSEIMKAYSTGIVTGKASGEFEPNKNATRAQAMVMIYRALIKEQSSVPDNSVLLETIQSVIDQENIVYESAKPLTAKAYQQLGGIYAKSMTGSYLAYNLEIMTRYRELAGEGFEMTVDPITTPSLIVLSKSNRFAVVESMQSGYDVSWKYQAKTARTNDHIDGFYFLKKHPDNGSWQIYLVYKYVK